MDRYVVIGHPVAHSRSPDIHARFAREMGEALSYERLEAPLDGFTRCAKSFFDGGGRGANVTLPFKIEAFAFAGVRTTRAEQAGAVNTLAWRGRELLGDNTDGAGLVADLERNLGVALRGASILLVGAGGAARGAAGPLLAARPARLVIANRSAAKARELAARFAGPVAGAGLADASGSFDVIVNATSASTQGEPLDLPDRVLVAGAFAYDMAYGPAAAGFLARARGAGLRASDGLGMLVEQAAESFELWRGKRPSTAPVLAALRAS